MSSMRNAVQRRNHRERAQPLEREKWGILEKHKDYSLRAKDHNEKKKRIKLLKQKAADRNPDEFAFGMMSTTTKNGVRITQRGKENGQTGVLSLDVVKLLKTQDAGYLQTILQQTRREREKVQNELVLAATVIDPSHVNSNKKTFDETISETKHDSDMRMGDDDDDEDDEEEEEIFSSDDEDSEPNNSKATNGPVETKEQIRRRRQKRDAKQVLQGRLDALRGREKDLTTALAGLDSQRAKMSNTVGGVNKNGVKFKLRERKR